MSLPVLFGELHVQLTEYVGERSQESVVSNSGVYKATFQRVLTVEQKENLKSRDSLYETLVSELLDRDSSKHWVTFGWF